MVNQGPEQPIAGNSAACAVAADARDFNDQVNGKLLNYDVYNAEADGGPVSPIILGVGMLVPGADDGPDEALIAADVEEEEAAEESNDALSARDIYGQFGAAT